MPTVFLAPVFGLNAQFFTNQGVVLAGGKIYTYTAGSTTPATTYTDSTGTVANSNPIVLDSAGRLTSAIWLPAGVQYKFVLTTSTGASVGLTLDNVSGINDTSTGGSPTAGAFTTLTASSTVSGAGFTALFNAPPAIGSVTPGTGAFTTLSATSTVGGAGFTNYLAAPPAIGTTTPAGGRFTYAHTAPVAVTFSATAMAVDCALSNVFTTTLTANVTTAPTLSNPKDGQSINWFLTQDGSGGRTMTWPTSFKWPGGSAGVLSTAINSVDLLVATYRASTGYWYCSLLKGFA